MSHIHLILAVDPASFDKDNVQQYLNELIAGHVMEVVPPEKVQEWIDEGFLRDHDDALHVQDLANTVLRHICNPRCQARVKAEGNESDTKCRKLHSVRDTPDPTRDCFIEMPFDWKLTTLELLEKINLYNKENGSFETPWFKPMRHMTACQPSATCNMSPVDRKLFTLFRSMSNLQWVLHTKGVCKYVVKYLVSCVVSPM